MLCRGAFTQQINILILCLSYRNIKQIIINIRGQIENRPLENRRARAASDSQRAVNALSALQLIGSWIIIRWILTNQGTLLTRENHLRAVRFEVNAVYH